MQRRSRRTCVPYECGGVKRGRAGVVRAKRVRLMGEGCQPREAALSRDVRRAIKARFPKGRIVFEQHLPTDLIGSHQGSRKYVGYVCGAYLYIQCGDQRKRKGTTP